jgi:SGNH hydrolase-like domain, acetyltransferase AlgX
VGDGCFATGREGFRHRAATRWLGRLLYAAFLAAATSVLAFAVLERFPDLARRTGLWRLRYYAIRSWYVPDPDLVLRYRAAGIARDSVSRGDQYSPLYGVPTPAIRSRRSVGADGFRLPTSAPPFEAVVIGDSFVEAGESDADTLPARLAALTGRSVLGLGMGFYGPPQYLALFESRAIPERPRAVLLCFFAGNDAADIARYQRWRETGRYGFFFDLSQLGFAARYETALGDLLDFLRARAQGLGRAFRARGGVHPELALLQLGGETVPARFSYWDAPLTPEALLASPSWRDLRSLLGELRDRSAEHGIAPFVVYVPTKAQIYAAFATPASGAEVRERLPDELRFGDAPGQALAGLVRELGLGWIDLRPMFRRLAAGGQQLYYPFDTHWNAAGRAAAAAVMAEALGWGSAGEEAGRYEPPSSPTP